MDEKYVGTCISCLGTWVCRLPQNPHSRAVEGVLRARVCTCWGPLLRVGCLQACSQGRVGVLLLNTYVCRPRTAGSWPCTSDHLVGGRASGLRAAVHGAGMVAWGRGRFLSSLYLLLELINKRQKKKTLKRKETSLNNTVYKHCLLVFMQIFAFCFQNSNTYSLQFFN